MVKQMCLAAGLVLCTAMFIGCEKKDESTTPPTPATPNASGEGTTGTGVGTAMKDAGNKAADASGTAMADAQKKLDEVMTYIKENKLDLAEKSLDGLEKMKDSLPASIQSQIGQARTMLNAAKAKATGLPG